MTPRQGGVRGVEGDVGGLAAEDDGARGEGVAAEPEVVEAAFSDLVLLQGGVMTRVWNSAARGVPAEANVVGAFLDNLERYQAGRPLTNVVDFSFA